MTPEEMETRLSELAADLAALNECTTAEALRRIMNVLQGEAEPIRIVRPLGTPTTPETSAD
jgi:hypothetical protein